MAYNVNPWAEANVINLLSLDKRLTPVEIDELLSELTLELWYRVLQDGIKPLLTAEDNKIITDTFLHTESPYEIIQWVQKNTTIVIEPIIEKISSDLKREFITAYFSDIQQTTTLSELHKHIQRLSEEIEKPIPNFTLVKKEAEYICSQIYT